MEVIIRPALGINAYLGTLYDASKDVFLPAPAFESDVEGVTTWEQNTTLNLSSGNDLRVKFNNLPNSLVASCLAGWIEYKGSGLYFAPTSSNGDIHHNLCLMQSTTRSEVDLANAKLRMSKAGLTAYPQATHVVTQILYGARCFVTASGSILDPSRRTKVLQTFASMLEHHERDNESNIGSENLLRTIHRFLEPSLSLTCYSDLSSLEARSLTTPAKIKQHLEMILDLASTGYEKAVPVEYILTPIEHIARSYNSLESIGQLSPRQFETVLELANSFAKTCLLLEKYQRAFKGNRLFIPADDVLNCREAIEDIKSAESSFRSRFTMLLTSIRAQVADSQEVESFIQEFTAGLSSSERFLTTISRSVQKVDLIEALRERGATCIISQHLAQYSSDAKYVFFFSASAMNHHSWKHNLNLAMQLLDDKSSKKPVIAVDSDGDTTPLIKARVAEFRNGKAYIEDMIERNKYEASLCFIKFLQDSVDSSVKDAPAQHKTVCIRCPGRNCGSSVHDWICQKCRVRVEFGVVDRFLYCECGRAPVNSASFNCQQNQDHDFVKFLPNELERLLKDLPAPPQINVLILGETGVGKSTFINSFINYLSYDKLDEALAAKTLECIIPCSFSTQSEGPGGKLMQTEISIGQDKDEHDGSRGQSATQDSNVYTIYYGGGMVRLIDTPGIGDTRGKSQDEENMMKILRVLRNYDQLHGILVLLKPNNARLTVMFKYCIKELLTQLHKSAAQNIVFGFTNTRGSNYQPGDTFKPLETLLEDHKDVMPGLFKDTVYCFDSESFRYLAAHHKGVDMGHIDDYRRSWDHSVTEARRLVTYFQARAPHEVRNTVSLNETRYLISQLIGPMARITNAIAATVEKSERQIADLQNTQLSGRRLAAQLKTTKIVIDSTPLDQPKTVCTNSKCCKSSTNGDDGDTEIKIFKRKCKSVGTEISRQLDTDEIKGHDPCSLKDVPPDVVGAQQIPPCAAFSGHEDCQICRHHWKEHQHIMIEYSERKETTTDPMVEQALNQTNNEASAKQVQVDVLRKQIRELQEEHSMIQKSQARFSHYLQQHSITHYNDATIEYYEHLIKEERTKVARGGPRTRLERMEQDQATYQHFVNAMKNARSNILEGPLDEDGVARLVQKLYKMKHYGSNLKDCAKKTGQAYAATYREKSYRVRKGHGGSGSYGFDVRTPNYSKSSMWPSVQRRDSKVPTDISTQSRSEQYAKQDDSLSWASRGVSKVLKRFGAEKTPAFTRRSSSHDSGEASMPTQPPPYKRDEDGIENYAPYNDDGQSDFVPVRAIMNVQPPNTGGVRNYLLDGDEVPPQQSHFASDGLLGHGHPVRVMHDSGDPVAPYGPNVLKRSKTKLLSSMSSMKSKLTRSSK